jgi:hypothetical protein
MATSTFIEDTQTALALCYRKVLWLKAILNEQHTKADVIDAVEALYTSKPMQQALEAYEQSKWQPITTAPHTVNVLCAGDAEEPYIAYWDDDYASWRTEFDTYSSCNNNPTYWQPLPKFTE